MSYTKRTCVKCGFRDIQPRMRQREVYVESGRSKKGASGATFLGHLLGDKRSSRSINDWMFNNGQRTYFRKKQIWLCPSCVKTHKSGKPADFSYLKIFLWLLIASPFIIGFIKNTAQ